MTEDITIRYVKKQDKSVWFSLDRHLSVCEFERKIRDKQGYVLCFKKNPVGILRYNLFWDNIPFCTMLYIDPKFQRMGYGRALLRFWESDMKARGYPSLLTSTQADESAQHFYRALGYADCGGLLAGGRPMELFLRKDI